MPVMLEDIGITGQNQQLLMNALNTVFSFLGGIVGSFMVDRLGRRNLFLWATFLTGLCYIALNIIAWKASATGHVSTGTGYAFIAMIFLYGIFYSFGCKCFVYMSNQVLLTFYPRDATPGTVPRRDLDERDES
jgi:MFS family permease